VVGIFLASKTKTKIFSQEILSPLQDPRSLAYFKDFLSCEDWTKVTNNNSTNAFVTFERIMQEANVPPSKKHFA
jgi:hypothetical protein